VISRVAWIAAIVVAGALVCSLADHAVAQEPAPLPEDRPTGPEYVELAGPPLPLKRVPAVARPGGPSADIEVAGLVKALVGKDGLVKDAEILKSAGPQLDEAALAAVRQWVFEPAMDRGRPVAVWVAIPVKFRADKNGALRTQWPSTPPADLRRALAQEIVALDADSARVPSAADMDLRRWIIEDALALDSLLTVPPEMQAHLERGRHARQRCGCHDSTLRAVDEFTAALHLAPWWGPAYGKLGDALLHLGRADEALICLELYLIAEPGAEDRARVERQVAGLRERAKPGR
jgi:protein TonB